MYANAGGVTVSYFEWLKNLNHVSFGRLNINHQVDFDRKIMESIEKYFGKSTPPPDPSFKVKDNNKSGNITEKDIVHSGLEYTMDRSANKIKEKVELHQLGLDLRTACYISSMEKIYDSYNEAGFVI